LNRLLRPLFSLLMATLGLALLPLLSACGGGAGTETSAFSQSAQRKVALADTAPTTLTVYYYRPAGDYDGWQIHTWNAAVDPGWNNGHNITRRETIAGRVIAVYEVPLAAQTGTVGYLLHKGDAKDHNNADQFHTLRAGANVVWRVQGDLTPYSSNPLEAPPPDITSVRVNYIRPAGDFAGWGLHVWAAGGLDVARMPAGVVIDSWPNAIGFDRMPNHRATETTATFDIPVLNPKDDSTRAALLFIIHGKAPNQDDKDGRTEDIRVTYKSLAINNQVGQIWLVQGDPTVYLSPPDTRRVSTRDARAFWLTQRLLQWPAATTAGTFKLYHSSRGALRVVKDQAVTGHDGALLLDVSTAPVATAVAERFKWIGSGPRFAVREADVARLDALFKQQLVLVQEDAQGRVQNATTAQIPGALDERYAAAENVNDLGVSISAGRTHFKLWAPTAQQVHLDLQDAGGRPVAMVPMAYDASTGVWSTSRAGDLTGHTYVFAVRVFVRGVGLVRNSVTDPYSLSLTTDSQRSWVGNLAAASSKPAGWEASSIPARVQATTDMSIYELHVRDFSIGDSSVPVAQRGKYLAFTQANSNGMRHLRALAEAGLTDVHLLPVFDIASVPEAACLTPNVPAAAADAEAQQAAVAASASRDCFNWGYDPWHFNAPEGSYASDAASPLVRVLEFRRMVMGLHEAGLRLGMDVVYNHTTASGQSSRSVLDRVVPGYYHRLNASGFVETSTCCDNTATEHLMMGKLMSDSVLLWAREYKVASFRFDIMGHQPRSVMEAMQARLRRELGREVQFLGEGWNFGEVVNGARFVQASMFSLQGSGIGTFNPFSRDSARGGSPFDSGDSLLSNQGWLTGVFYDPNALGTGASVQDLLYHGDYVRAGLAGSIRDFAMQTRTGAVQLLSQMDRAPGYVAEPGEAVNYVENHDNQTLFDNNAFKLPQNTSREDRARVQMLGAAMTLFSQGVPYFHAGVDTLRSKSLDRNSYDAGDWFNRIDWTYQDNYFGTGLPMFGDNGSNWGVMRPVLANPAIKPTPGEIAFARDAFRDLLRLRASTTLLRLRTAADIRSRLAFFNTGPNQVGTVMVGYVNGAGYAGAGFRELAYFINVDKVARDIDIAPAAGRNFVLHPVHRAATAADRRAATASVNNATGRFSIPARTAVVFVVE
jgi:pullulanase